MADIPSSVPAAVTAGDTLSWRITLGDYPASAGWSLAYRLINASGHYDITATASGDDFVVSVPASTSAGYAPGEYAWQAYVSRGTERYTVDSGVLTVRPNLAAQAGGFDMRSHARKMLAAIEAWLESRDPGVADYQIAGRAMRYVPRGELLALRDRYRNEVRMEEAADRLAKGLEPANRLLVRF